MKEFYGFFNSTENDQREYIDHELAEAFKTLAPDGVANSGDCLRVQEVTGSMTVRVSYGSAMVNGRVYTLRDDGGSPLTLEIATSASSTRIDRVVLRLNLATNARNIGAFVLTGTPGANPQAPSLTRQGEIYEISLAQIRVEPGALAITQAMITDERLNEEVCGVVSLKRSELADAHRHANATASVDGFMAKGDKAKIDLVDQDLRKVAKPTFAGAILNGNVAMSGTLTLDGVISGARFE